MKNETNSSTKKAVAFDTKVKTNTETYDNPLNRANNQGDPFVMRYDGRYYLYPSTGADVAYHVQVSEDLVNWTERIDCVPTDEIPSGINEHGGNNPIALPAYAPEVTCFNGQFVMVTSLGGTGHQFFVADSPIGPFKKVGEQWGCKIDGHIFIDNDGKWYFYSAHADGGLHGFKMTAPTCVDVSTEQPVGAIIDEGNGTWTEGPGIIYHDGTYFLTYTGNHVCHEAYRIAYGTSKGDMMKFVQGKPNPLLVSTTKVTSGIGHSSSVKAPDLDTYYIVYHTRERQRFLNIDRFVLNGRKMDVFGPTVKNSPVPPMPDIYSHFSRKSDEKAFTGDFTVENGKLLIKTPGTVLAKEKLERDRYTIELTVRNIGKEGLAGLVFGYEDDSNYGEALFDTNTEELVVRFKVNGETTEYRKALVRSFDIPYKFSVLQAIQVEKTGKEFTFYVNDRLLCKYESELSGTGIGMKSENAPAAFGFIGATAATGGSSSKKYPKPVATQCGYLPAIYCKEYGYKTDFTPDTEEEYVCAVEGETYNYAIYSEQAGSYGLSATYKSENGAVLEIYADEKYIKDIVLPASTEFTSATVRDIALIDGEQTLTVYVKEGNADILHYRCMYNVATEAIGTDALSYSDGIFWEENDGIISVSSCGKRLYGSYMLGDYKLSADIVPLSREGYGLLVRTQNPGQPLFTHRPYSDPEKQIGAKQGINWMQGYYVEFSATTLTLYKISFTKTVLATAELAPNRGRRFHADVICEGSKISVIVNDNTVLEYTDPDPYTNGMAGLKSEANGVVSFANVEIKPLG